MGEVYFYHLTRSSVDHTLAVLLGKCRQVGWRVAVRGRDRARLEWLDEKLWMGPDDGFLPHGMSGGPHDKDQPVLLTTDRASANAPACVMSVDGAEIDPEEVAGLERVCILFDGQDDLAVQHARGQWRALTGAGCAAQYWSEAGGRWEKKA